MSKICIIPRVEGTGGMASFRIKFEQGLRARGVDAVVLGCTELPIALPASRRADLGVVIVDSIDALAKASISWHDSAVAR